jgi:hypothetical protein
MVKCHYIYIFIFHRYEHCRAHVPISVLEKILVSRIPLVGSASVLA